MTAILVSIVAGIAGFLIIVYIRKGSIPRGIVFGLFLLIATLFLFDKIFNIEFMKRQSPPVYLLIDKSLSAKINETQKENLLSLKRLISDRRIYYFADTISQDTNTLNPQYTSLIDSVATLQNTAPGNARIIIASDFNDNRSFAPLDKNISETRPDKFFPVIMENPEDKPLSIYDLEIPEIIQSGEPVEIKVRIYSRNPDSAILSVKDGTRVLSRKNLSLSEGLTPVTIRETLYGEGYRTFEFELQKHGETVSSHKFLVSLVPDFYRILVIAGRPSSEFVFLRRFLERLKWIRSDFIVLTGPNDKARLQNLNRYSGIILMDITDNRIENLEALSQYDKPVFYQPGLNDSLSILRIMSHFTNIDLRDNPSQQRFIFNNTELVIKTAFNIEAPLLEISPERRIFFGWESWRWDFMQLPVGIAQNNYDAFWKNQVNFIISADMVSPVVSRLNYITGERTPAPHKDTGLYTFVTNNEEMRFMVSENPAETAVLFPDIKTAMVYNTNITRLAELNNPSRFIDKITGEQKIEVKQRFTIDTRNNLIILILMAGLLILFWILSDRENIAS